MAEYRNPEFLTKRDAFTWDPSQQLYEGDAGTSPDFLGWLMNWRGHTPTGKNPGEVALAEMEQAEWRKKEAAARAIPTRDVSTLQAGWGGIDKDDPTWWTSLNPLSPDAAPIALSLRDKLDAGTATAHERDLYNGVMGLAGDWSARASKPDPWNPLGDQLFGALGTLALGATGGLAAAPLAAGGASLATTLGSLGTLSGIAGTGAGVLGEATQQPWLQRLGMGLGAAGGIAGGLGGLANLWGTGINSLGDAARLASNAGRVVGGVGAIADNDVLRQAGGWLGTAGQLGSGVNTVADVFGGGVSDLTDLARLAQGAGQVTGAVGRVTGNRPLQQASGILGMGSRLGGVGSLLGAAQQAQRGGVRPPVQSPQPQQNAPLSNEDWLRWTGQPGPWQANQTPQSTLWNL